MVRVHFNRCCHIAFQKFCNNTHLHQPVLLFDISKRGSCPGPCALDDPHITVTQNSWCIADPWGISVTQQWHSITHSPHHPLLWQISFSPQGSASLHLLLYVLEVKTTWVKRFVEYATADIRNRPCFGVWGRLEQQKDLGKRKRQYFVKQILA